MPLPERQFLIEKNWHFFDSFEFAEEKPEKIGCRELPDIKLEFFSENLPKTIEELAKLDRAEAKSLLSLLALSHELFLPLEKIPSAGFQRQEIFLENELFKNNFVPEQLAKGTEKENHTTQAAGFLRGTPEFDIAPVVPMLLTDSVFNTSFETINCSCCKPNDFSDNLLQNSQVNVEFLKDAFYFDSTNADFAHCFHETHGLKDNRARRKKEFFLKHFPVGPFNRNQGAIIPLPDAAVLQKNSDAKIIGLKEKNWFCTKKQGFVSKTIKELGKKSNTVEKSLEKNKGKNTTGKGIIECLEMEQDYYGELLREHKKTMDFFLHNLPAHLANSESRFYSKELASAIEAILGNALHAWDSLKEKQGMGTEEKINMLVGKGYAPAGIRTRVATLARLYPTTRLQAQIA